MKCVTMIHVNGKYVGDSGLSKEDILKKLDLTVYTESTYVLHVIGINSKKEGVIRLPYLAIQSSDIKLEDRE